MRLARVAVLRLQRAVLASEWPWCQPLARALFLELPECVNSMRTAVPIFIFLGGGVAGPLLRWATWHPGRVGDGTGFSISDFLYSLVLLLWPTQPLGVMEASLGRHMAVVVTVGANLIVFGVAGVIVAIAARRLPLLIAIYILICLMLSAFAFWIAGNQIDVVALLVAFALYGLLFLVAFRVTRERAIQLPA